MKPNKNFLIILILLTAVSATAYFYISRPQTEEVDNKANLKIFTTKKGKTDLIRIFTPKENNPISSPLEVSGKARGSWFFEADFLVILTNWDGLIIAQAIAQAQGDWMTENFIPFSVTLNFENPVFPGADKNHFSRRGFLILQKNNPSGLFQNDDLIEIPVLFK